MNLFLGVVARATQNHAIRFLIVGTINTGFSYLIYAVCLYIGFRYQFANLIAVILGIIFSFKTQGHFVFKNPNNKLFGRFLLSWLFIYLCTIGIIGRIIGFGFDPYTAGAMALPFSVTLSYLTQKYFVFRLSSNTTQQKLD